MIIVKHLDKTGMDTMDLFNLAFLEQRTIYLVGEITECTAAEIITQLEYLDEAGEEEIRLVINSPGGSVMSGLAIVDAVERCRCDVSTMATGVAGSMAALILSCGTKGKRFVSPRAEVMIHQPLGGVQGQAAEIDLVAQHIIKTRNRLNALLAQNTGRTMEQVARDCDRDCFMTAREAVDYGIADALWEQGTKTKGRRR